MKQQLKCDCYGSKTPSFEKSFIVEVHQDVLLGL